MTKSHLNCGVEFTIPVAVTVSFAVQKTCNHEAMSTQENNGEQWRTKGTECHDTMQQNESKCKESATQCREVNQCSTEEKGDPNYKIQSTKVTWQQLTAKALWTFTFRTNPLMSEHYGKYYRPKILAVNVICFI